MKITRPTAALLLALSLGGGAALAYPQVVGAQESPATTAPPAEPEDAELDEPELDNELDDDAGLEPDHDECEFLDLEDLTDEEKAEINEVTEKLIAELEAAGIPVERFDEDGIVDFDVDIDDSDPAVWDQVDEIFERVLGDEDLFFDVFGEWDEEWDGEWELTPEEIAEWNAETEALVAALRDAGIEVTVETDEDGLTFFDLDDADWDAAEAIIDQFFAELDADDENESDADETDGDD